MTDETARSVGTRVVEGADARVVTLRRTYATHPEDLWEAVTSAERIGRWFAPVSGDLRLGGTYAIEGNASGTVTACDPPRSFALTWEFGGDVSWVEVRLEPDGAERTTLVLEHAAHVGDERWGEYGPGAVGIGWDLGLHGLAMHLASGAGATRDEGMAWMASPEGVAYMTRCNDAWRDASVAAGEAPEAAQAAADRTIAAYTGAPGAS
jgi:uncharacterized protein YndB with AHSA1/START domain